MFIILTFIILVASFLIAATLIVFVIEKGKEIAILKSMGATDTSIMKVFVTYGLIVGTLGTSVGLAVGLGNLANLIFQWVMGARWEGYSLFTFPTWLLFGTVAFAIVIAGLAGIYPSHRAARLDPIQALRYD